MRLADIPSVREDSLMIDACNAIAVAIFPFKPGIITGWISEDLSERAIQITVENLPKLNFKINIEDGLIASHPIGFKSLMLESIFEYYHNRPTLPVDDHILLGEE